MAPAKARPSLGGGSLQTSCPSLVLFMVNMLSFRLCTILRRFIYSSVLSRIYTPMNIKPLNFMRRGVLLLPSVLIKSTPGYRNTASLAPFLPRLGGRGIVIQDCTVHMIADQISISYSIITLVNLK